MTHNFFSAAPLKKIRVDFTGYILHGTLQVQLSGYRLNVWIFSSTLCLLYNEGFWHLKHCKIVYWIQIQIENFGTEILQSDIASFSYSFLYYVMRLFGISNCAKFLQRLPWIWSRYHLMTWKITQRFHFPIVTFLCSLS